MATAAEVTSRWNGGDGQREPRGVKFADSPRLSAIDDRQATIGPQQEQADTDLFFRQLKLFAEDATI
ncbi:MAG: hypothetical protein ACK53L_08780, partial [Pirellulaceae bacterium]